MTVNFLYDALNGFGERVTAGDFPNTIGMGEASAERMAVDIKLPGGPVTSAAGVTFSVRGSDTAAGTYSAIVTGHAVSAADLNGEGYSLPIPKTKFKFLRVNAAGTFTGTLQAILNSYLGK